MDDETSNCLEEDEQQVANTVDATDLVRHNDVSMAK